MGRKYISEVHSNAKYIHNQPVLYHVKEGAHRKTIDMQNSCKIVISFNRSPQTFIDWILTFA